MDNKRLLPIVLIIFVNILGGGVILPILPLYAEGQFRGTVLQVTLLATASPRGPCRSCAGQQSLATGGAGRSINS